MRKTVVITRPQGPYSGAAQLANNLSAEGFACFELPLLMCEPISPQADTIATIRRIVETPHSWVAFLSPTAVHVFRNLLERELPSEVALKGVLCAAQGMGTAKAVQECFGRAPDFVPSVFIAEEFAREFTERVGKGQRILIPQSADGRDIVGPMLVRSGRDAFSFDLYRMRRVPVPPEVHRSFQELPDATTFVVFMSPSAVRAAVEGVGEALRTKRLISVGPITSAAIRKEGLSVWREAREHSEQGVLEVLRAER